MEKTKKEKNPNIGLIVGNYHTNTQTGWQTKQILTRLFLFTWRFLILVDYIRPTFVRAYTSENMWKCTLDNTITYKLIKITKGVCLSETDLSGPPSFFWMFLLLLKELIFIFLIVAYM